MTVGLVAVRAVAIGLTAVGAVTAGMVGVGLLQLDELIGVAGQVAMPHCAQWSAHDESGRR